MAIEPNRFAGPTEAALLREHISAEQEDLQRVEERLKLAHVRLHDAEHALASAQEAADSARAIVARMEAQKLSLMEGLMHARGLLHPVRRLPSEILAQIFLHRLDDATFIQCRSNYGQIQSAPFTLARVCRRWRAVALGMPSLWAHITIDFHTARPRAQAWLEYVLLLLRLSASTPLYLRINTSAGPLSTTLILDRIWANLKAALRTRCRALYLRCYNGGDSDFHEFIREHAPELETCSIYMSDGLDSHVPLMVFASAPRLRTLLLDEAFVEWDRGSRCDAMKKLSLSRSELTAVSTAELALAATRLPNLEELELCVDLVSRNPTTVRLTSLRVLHLSGHLEATAAQSFFFPALQELTLVVPETEVCVLFLRHGLAQSRGIRKMEISDMRADAELADALSAFEKLGELALVNCQMADSFCQRLARPQGADGRWLCPQLSSLYIARVRPSSTERMSFDGASLLDLVRARRPRTPSGAAAVPCRLSDVMVTWVRDAEYAIEGFEAKLRELMT